MTKKMGRLPLWVILGLAGLVVLTDLYIISVVVAQLCAVPSVWVISWAATSLAIS